jgi:ABC-type transporter Mla subunit MlaD
MGKNTPPNGMTTNSDPAAGAAVVQTLTALCAGLLPVWSLHLATSRSQSETAVSEMMQAFANIIPHVRLAERQSQQIADALNQGDPSIAGLAQACENAIAPLLHHAQLPAGGAQAIAAVLAMVRNAVGVIEQFSQPLSLQTQLVAEHVERMYIVFQFQDRISQMMALLETDMARLQELVNGRGTDTADLQAWLTRLQTQYAKLEQRQSYASASEGGAGAAQETTFF